MHTRSRLTSVALFAALLVLAVAALTPTALAATSPSPSASPVATAPKGTPVPVGVIPDPHAIITSGNGKLWSGDSVQVNFSPNGATLDPAKCQVYINNNLQKLSSAPNIVYLSPATPTLNFALTANYGRGSYDFKVIMVTTKGVTVEKTWTYDSQGKAGGALVKWSVIKNWWVYIAKGAIVTVELTVISIFFACILALFGSLGRLSKKMSFRQAWDRYQSWSFMWRMVLGRIPYWAATFYTSLFRGTPLLLQIIAIYQVIPEFIRAFGLPQTLNPPAFWSGVAALSLNYGAYLTEVFRAGIQAVPKGQNEAAWAIGLSGWQTQRRIILPQAFKIVIPAVGNDFIALIKDTSLVSVITVEELLRRAQLAGAATFSFMSALLVAAAFYWALTIFFSFWQAKLENRMARDKAREKQKGKN
ncbi:MAG TPA: amino acid ABC transporter permease [Thermoleophilia bacterium]|nr:amino acid ABC transporter permease [Thermoleophilia bacterium]